MIDRTEEIDALVLEAMALASEYEGCLLSSLVGSVAIEGKGNDVDHLWLVVNKGDVIQYLTGLGFIHEGNITYNNGDFESFRRMPLNIIITDLPKIFETWKVAVEVCKYVGVRTREERVAIHQIVMDGNASDEVNGVFIRG